MHKFIRWYNQNRAEAIIIIAIIAFAFIMLQVLNSIVARNAEQSNNEISSKNSSTSQSTIISKTNKSVITGEKVPTGVSNTYENIIKEFIENCNTGKTSEAYNMLSEECKETMYPTLGDFTRNYYKRIFNINRIYTIENWFREGTTCTYYIKYMEDILSTGNVSSNNDRSDYITVIVQDNTYKLNIGGYVRRNMSKQTATKNNVQIAINWVDMYIDYCILNITIINNTQNTICIDTKESAKTTFIYDENKTKYSSFLNEIAQEELIIKKSETKNLDIKFSQMYNPSRGVSGIVFQDVVINYDNYINKLEGKNRVTINT